MIIHRNSLGLLMNDLAFTNAAEIGVQKGEFSKIILTKWHIGHLTLIDAWTQFINMRVCMKIFLYGLIK